MLAKIRRNPVMAGFIIVFSLLSGVATLLSTIIDLSGVFQSEPPPVISARDDEPAPTPTAVPINPALLGAVEISEHEVWAATIDQTDDNRWPLSDAVESVALQSPAEQDGRLSAEALQAAAKLTERMTRGRGVDDSRIAWFLAPGIRLDSTRTLPEGARAKYKPVDPETRVRKFLAWLAPDVPQVSLLHLGPSHVEIGGLAEATRTTRADLVSESFPGVSELATRVVAGEDVEKLCEEVVAFPLHGTERGTPTRTGCPLYVVGEPIEQLIVEDGRLSLPINRTLVLSAEQIQALGGRAGQRYDDAAAEEKLARAADLVVARLLDWIALRALQSTQVIVVKGGGRAWILQYLEENNERLKE